MSSGKDTRTAGATAIPVKTTDRPTGKGLRWINRIFRGRARVQGRCRVFWRKPMALFLHPDSCVRLHPSVALCFVVSGAHCGAFWSSRLTPTPAAYLHSRQHLQDLADRVPESLKQLVSSTRSAATFVRPCSRAPSAGVRFACRSAGPGGSSGGEAP